MTDTDRQINKRSDGPDGAKNLKRRRLKGRVSLQEIATRKDRIHASRLLEVDLMQSTPKSRLPLKKTNKRVTSEYPNNPKSISQYSRSTPCTSSEERRIDQGNLDLSGELTRAFWGLQVLSQSSNGSKAIQTDLSSKPPVHSRSESRPITMTLVASAYAVPCSDRSNGDGELKLGFFVVIVFYIYLEINMGKMGRVLPTPWLDILLLQITRWKKIHSLILLILFIPFDILFSFSAPVNGAWWWKAELSAEYPFGETLLGDGRILVRQLRPDRAKEDPQPPNIIFYQDSNVTNVGAEYLLISSVKLQYFVPQSLVNHRETEGCPGKHRCGLDPMELPSSPSTTHLSICSPLTMVYGALYTGNTRDGVHKPYGLLMLSLKENIEGALLRDDTKAIVITGVKGKFSAGFDVTSFGGSREKKEKKELGFMSIHIVTNTLEAARKPVVAAIEGPAFGGGLEIALACHARIATPSAQLGLTELQYGILPGFGGTQRLPRLVGLRKALEMILMSKRVDGKEARNMSLVDALAPADELLGVACQWALDMFECRKPWVISLYRTDKLEPMREARAILKSFRMQVQKDNPNVVHPLVCIDVIEQGIICGPHNALWKEAEALEELRQSSTCRSLIHVFFAQREVLKIPEISRMNLRPRKIEKVAVIGGGLNSCEIATFLVLRNYKVILKLNNKKNLLVEIGRNGKATQVGVEKAFNLLAGALDYENLKDIDLAIEAESESLPLKQEIFAELEKSCPPHCIFATNTSSFSLKSIGERSKSQNQIAGIRFCLQPVTTPLMEIVRTESTSPQVIVDLTSFTRKIRRTPIIICDRKGYSVDNMLVAYLHSAILIAEHGVDFYRIDQTLQGFGMQLGPFRMIDIVPFFGNLLDKSYRPKLIRVLQHEGLLGECNGKGFYEYDNHGKASPNPKIVDYIGKARTNLNMTSDLKMTNLSEEEMVEMILFPALNEACRLISEGIVIRSSDLDVASVLGMGFPSYRGGIIYWSKSFGPNYVYSRLVSWSNEYGEFFKPCDYLRELSAKRIFLGRERKQHKPKL
ncbi:fatty acid oxidation complex subunit alpha [Striga asiatica]|uniref:Fatty acid oxidation complex subunit alpha n=1 Tax=Striga asiatica TaxID=4170 RepID=A0A5A7PPL7_STRAF|nr:fatty acid oxidation complex subunit alpha [Striga asiatica]